MNQQTPILAAAEPRLGARDATIGFDKRIIAEGLTFAIPDRSFTVIVGPNACGKSTLLRALSRLLKPSAGDVVLDGKAIHTYAARDVAQRLGLLPQTSIAPDGITVADLVARGRYPHQNLLRQWSKDDESAVVDAMAATRVGPLSLYWLGAVRVLAPLSAAALSIVVERSIGALRDAHSRRRPDR